MTISRIPSVEGGIQPTLLTAKGDLISATAASTVARLAVGSDAQILVADSTASTGLKWATPDTAGTWTDYTPTITAEAGTATTVTSQAGRYQMLNSKTCLVQAQWRVVSKGTAVGETYFTLPFTSRNGTLTAVGAARETESAGALGFVDVRANQNYGRTSNYLGSAAGTWWVNNYTIRAQVVFEVA